MLKKSSIIDIHAILFLIDWKILAFYISDYNKLVAHETNNI